MDFSDFTSTPLDKAVADHRGWTLPNERRFNQWFTREVYRGRGAIVDLGCMNGSSTAALATGLAANPRVSGRKVHAFDRFIKTWDTVPGEPLEDVPHGADFFGRFVEHTAPWKDLIEAHRGDVGNVDWRGGPIEYLVVDLMKSWSTARSVATRFLPAVLEGDGLIVHQDFLHFYTPWIHLIMHRLRRALEPAFEVPDSCSVVFRKTRALDVEECRTATDFSSVTRGEVDEAFAYSDGIIAKNPKAALRAAKAMFFYHYAHLEWKSKGADESYARWMDLAIRELDQIGPEHRSHRDVVRAGGMIRGAERRVRRHAPGLPTPGASSSGYGPGWTVRAVEGSSATLATTPDGAMKVEILERRDGPAWHVQLVGPSRAVCAGRRYEISFRARSSAPRSIRIVAMEGQPPSAPIGLAQACELGAEWREFRFDFAATKDDGAARLRFNLGASDEAVEIADVEFGEPKPASSPPTPPAPRIAAAGAPAQDGGIKAAARDHVSATRALEPQLQRARALQAVIPPGGIGAECGVFKGEFSQALLDLLAPRKLYLIDPWYLMTREWHWGTGDRSTISAVCGILRRFEDELVSGRVVLQIDDDLHALSQLPDHHLDWAYLDSTHGYGATVKELALLRRKVRPNGIIAGHDWQPDPAHKHHGVCKAVREAVARSEFELVLVDAPTIQWAVRLPG